MGERASSDVFLRSMKRWAGLLLLGLGLGCGSSGPTPGGPCQSQGDCVDGEVCISGVCQVVGSVECRNDEACPLGERCDLESSTCVTIVVPDAGPLPQDGGPNDTGASMTDGGADAGVDAGPVDTGGNGSCTIDTECGTPPVDVCVANTCVK